MTQQPNVQFSGVWRTWLITVITLFVLLAAVFLAWQPYVGEFLYEHLLAAGLEERYGFRGGRVAIQTPDGERSVYTLLEVTPGGAIERAGFRVGDVPSGAFHSQSAAFLRALSEACDHPDREIVIGSTGPGGAGQQRRVQLPCVR